MVKKITSLFIASIAFYFAFSQIEAKLQKIIALPNPCILQGNYAFFFQNNALNLLNLQDKHTISVECSYNYASYLAACCNLRFAALFPDKTLLIYDNNLNIINSIALKNISWPQFLAFPCASAIWTYDALNSQLVRIPLPQNNFNSEQIFPVSQSVLKLKAINSKIFFATADSIYAIMPNYDFKCISRNHGDFFFCNNCKIYLTQSKLIIKTDSAQIQIPNKNNYHYICGFSQGDNRHSLGTIALAQKDSCVIFKILLCSKSSSSPQNKSPDHTQ